SAPLSLNGNPNLRPLLRRCANSGHSQVLDIIPLRVVALTSNIAFLIYGIGLGLAPVWLLHAILLPINGWRLWQATACRCAAQPKSGVRDERRHRRIHWQHPGAL